jgi:hypothetical protein
MNKSITQTLLCVLLVLGLSQLSCEDKVTVPDGAFEKQAKPLTGTWKITKLTRNGVDLTGRFDFSQFSLAFATNGEGTGTYTTVNNAPFLVSKSGTWVFDDPAYPTAVAFTQEGSTSLRIAEIFTPLIYTNQLSLKFSPGCEGNTYEYTLKSVSE